MKIGDLVYITENTIWARPWGNQYAIILSIDMEIKETRVRTFNCDYMSRGLYHSEIIVEVNCLVKI